MVKHRNIVGWITILSGVIGFISYFLVGGAVNFNFEFFSDPKLIFSMENVNVLMLKWSMITDIFGYYLLLLPVLFLIHGWLKEKTEFRNVITFCGAAYILAGALGASILGAAWPDLLEKFPSATPGQQEIIKSIFENLAMIVGTGIWNIFDALMFGVWFLSIGSLIKIDNAILGWFTILIGVLSLLDFTGNALGIKALSETALNLYLILAPLWAIAFGWSLKRNKVLQH